MKHYPRWQNHVTDPVLAWAVRHGLGLETSRRIEIVANRALGQPLSARRWSEMTFNDKVLFRKLRVHDERYRVFSDKLSCRAWVAERVGWDHVAPIRAFAEHAEDLADLVGPFIVKANHGSGLVIPVTETRRLSEAECALANSWLGEDYALWSREWAYEGIERRLYVEEILSVPVPVDYKFFVFDGVPRAIHVDIDRYGDHRRSVMTPEWTTMGTLDLDLPPRAPDPPANLASMMELAGALGAGHDFIRVDLFDLGERIYVGEMTVYPLSGHANFSPRGLDRRLGEFWTKIPELAPSL